MRNLHPLLRLMAWVAFSSCGESGESGDGDGASSVPSEPVVLDATELTYSLTQSVEGLALWTTPCTHKVLTNERPPSAVESGLRLHAAKGEFEPVQLLIGPASGSISLFLEPFSTLGEGYRAALFRAEYESGYAEHLVPVGDSEEIVLSDDHAIPIWLDLYIPEGASAGEHVTHLQVRYGETRIAVPITAAVFDFALPREIHFATQLNIDVSGLIPEGGSVDAAKSLLFDHRMTPKSVTWPSGFQWGITWENERSTDPCETFWDEPDEPEGYSVGALSRRYILGEGWNQVGFPNAMIFQFVDNGTPRPDTLCGISRGDHYGTDAYNAEWSEFLENLEDYLRENGLLERAYYYVQNEPQDEEDHALAAHLCRLNKAAAPDLRIAVSDEPKPEIAEHADGACGYDIWIAHVRHYQQTYAWERQRDFGETVWFYSLDQDPDPYFNPTRVDVQGVHQRIIPWVAWSERIRGWAYYDANRFFDGPVPTIRAKLLREGFEDYEYLYLANGGAHPEPFVDSPVDSTVRSAASGLTSWTRDADALMALRRALGSYLEGSADALPVMETGSDIRPRDAYYINFQDPTGSPTADPLTIDGNTYMKVGWSSYDDALGYGWYGEYVENSDIALYGYDETAGYTEAQRSYLYDDYGRDNLFELALENGRYQVTVGVGRPGRGYDDPHNVTVEGQKIVDEQTTTGDSPTIQATATVDLTDGSLSIVTGGRSEITGDFAYTFVAYLVVIPLDE